MRIKEGPDAATQEFSARPGKKNLERPLQWVQMDHTLVDIILLADDRINIMLSDRQLLRERTSEKPMRNIVPASSIVAQSASEP